MDRDEQSTRTTQHLHLLTPFVPSACSVRLSLTAASVREGWLGGGGGEAVGGGCGFSHFKQHGH